MSDEYSVSRSLQSTKTRLSSSFAWKAGILLVLGLILMIPLSQIRGLLWERTNRKHVAIQEIGRQWGESQELYGPALRIPVSWEEEVEERTMINGYVNTQQKTVEKEDYLILLPEDYRLSAEIEPEIRYRGIFRTPVYSAAVEIEGNWMISRVSKDLIDGKEVDWSRAALIFRVSDAKGISNLVEGGNADGRIAYPLHLVNGGEWIAFDYPVDTEQQEFELDLSFQLRGSGSLKFLPVGRSGEVEIKSTWADPSFAGSMLPSSRTVSDEGFEALWQFGEFGRTFPQQWLEGNKAPGIGDFNLSLSGVDLVDPVDGYRMTERSLKYGALFVATGFIVFFLFEALCEARLHPMHYLLAGAAQAVFFMLVLSLSELIDFTLAYSIAAIAATLMVSLYAGSVLGSWTRSSVVAGILVALYGMLLVILQQQDYSLLTGSGLVFVALSVLMYLTRNLDWGRSGRERKVQA